MDADALYDSIRSNLRVNARVISLTGSRIDVGEKFTLRFTGTNFCPAEWIPWWKQPDIIFDNVRIFVRGTDYAEPVTGAGWHNLPDQRLYPGESSHVDIEFEAKTTWYPDWVPEPVAEAFIRGDLDQDRFFQVWNHMRAHANVHKLVT